jgi:methyltransferase
MSQKPTLLKTFILLGNVGVPAATILLFLVSPKRSEQIFFLVFMLFHAFERVWETFYTSRERKAFEFHGDWTLGAVTAAYLFLCFLVIFEFFLMPRSFQWGIAFIGLGLYGAAFRLRWWGMKSLGKQWAIHAVGARKIKKVRLIKLGAYKYMRHPIYLGIILEVLSLPLIANAYLALALACLVNIPLQIIRLWEEEKSSLRRLGEPYRTYQKEVDMLIPFRYFSQKFK